VSRLDAAASPGFGAVTVAEARRRFGIRRQPRIRASVVVVVAVAVAVAVAFRRPAFKMF
jgi:hypothetical protein